MRQAHAWQFRAGFFIHWIVAIGLYMADLKVLSLAFVILSLPWLWRLTDQHE